MAICYIGKVISPRKNVLEEKVFRSKKQADMFKQEIESDSDNKVKFKKAQC